MSNPLLSNHSLVKLTRANVILTPWHGGQVIADYSVPLESEAIARAFFLGMFAALDLSPCKVSLCADVPGADSLPAWFNDTNGKLYFHEDGTPR